MRCAVLVRFVGIVSMPVILACAASNVSGTPRDSARTEDAEASTDPGNDDRARAMTVAVAEPAFDETNVVMAKSMPPQFTVVLKREMPTPGWSFAVDSVDVDERAGRIVARLSEVAPSGITAQVITRASCRIPLGSIGKGRYLLEIWLRRGTSGDHGLAQAIIVNAR